MRRWVTGISVIMLLLCQTIAAALAYVGAAATETMAVTATQVTSMSAETSCHHDAANGTDNLPANGCHDRCPSQNASFETSRIDIPAASVAALPIYLAMAPPLAMAMTAQGDQVVARASPPPLRLVYCRLLD